MWKRLITSPVVRRNRCLRKAHLFCPLTNLMTFNRKYCDIKTNVELLFRNNETPVIPSVLKIKRAIKSQTNYELNDGFACIRTKCPACTLPKQSATANNVDAKNENNIYINKSSGEFIVCVIGHGSWSIRFHYDSRLKKVMKHHTHLRQYRTNEL